VAPELAKSESLNRANTPLTQLLRLAWGFKEVNDDHLDEVRIFDNIVFSSMGVCGVIVRLSVLLY
jgi:hypothetical protein